MLSNEKHINAYGIVTGTLPVESYGERVSQPTKFIRVRVTEN
jgi:hypothetical protein